MPRRSHHALRRDREDDRRGGWRGPATEDSTVGPGWQQLHRIREGDFLVRTVPGAAARKAYRCPACQQEIPPGTAHLVVWPADDDWSAGGVAQRRHWHRSCWERRSARGGPGPLPW